MKGATTEDIDRPPVIGVLVGEIAAALAAPRRYARSLLDRRHGLSTLIVVLVAGTSLAVTVSLLAAASGSGAPPAAVITDALLFSARLALVLSLAAALARAVSRAPGRSLPLDLAFAGVGLSLSPLTVAPLALLPGLAGHWLAVPAVLVGLAIWSFWLLTLNLRVLVPHRAWMLGAALAVPLVAYGVSDRLIQAGVFAMTLDPRIAPQLPVPPATGTRHDFASLSLTLPDGWRRVSTSNDVARFETDVLILRVVRMSPRTLDTIVSAADDFLARESRGLQTRETRRSIWHAARRLVVEDGRQGIYEDRLMSEVLFTQTTAMGPIGLFFRHVGSEDLSDLMARSRPIAQTLVDVEGR